MDTTSAKLLERLRQPGDEKSWDRFVQLYTPLLLHWARRLGLQDADAADLVQDVLTTLCQKLPGFRYEPSRCFRGWLWTLTRNTWRMNCRRRGGAAPVAPEILDEFPGNGDPQALEDAEYRRFLVGRALQLMQTDFEPATWRACWEYVITNRPAAEVGAELGLSVGAVYVAKSRVLRRLREELAGLLD